MVADSVPRDRALVGGILRVVHLGYVRVVETTSLNEPVFELTAAGARWLTLGEVYLEGYA